MKSRNKKKSHMKISKRRSFACPINKESPPEDHQDLLHFDQVVT
jgi:hypothetical protein